MAVDWRMEVRGSTRSDFIARHSHPFLLLLDDRDDGTSTGQHLSIITKDMDDHPKDGAPGSVLPLIKVADNPYERKIIIGRARNCDAVIRHESVSKFHAEIRLETLENGTIVDRSSRNGTRINERPVGKTARLPLRAGDRLRFGAVATVFLDPGRLYDALS